MKYSDQTIMTWGLTVLKIEAEALQELSKKLDNNFIQACRLICKCEGRVIVIGMGKSGHIGRKIAATFASTGTPSFFVHPAEASHGDLGMITPHDIILALSNSGETNEIMSIIPFIKHQRLPLISLTGAPGSQLAKHSTFHIDVSINKEACSLGLAPTASTTVALAMGDALAVAALQTKGFTAEDFGRSHPGGKLGRRLLTKISDIMHVSNNIPRVTEHADLPTAILEISQKCLGMTLIVSEKNKNKILGIFTDGDLRRIFSSLSDLNNLKIKDIMVKDFITIRQDILAVNALILMEKHKIAVLPVVSSDEELVGAINLHDLFKAGVV